MKRITVNEDLYARFKELCSTNNSASADMLETLMDSYTSMEELANMSDDLASNL